MTDSAPKYSFNQSLKIKEITYLFLFLINQIFTSNPAITNTKTPAPIPMYVISWGGNVVVFSVEFMLLKVLLGITGDVEYSVEVRLIDPVEFFVEDWVL